MHKRNDELKALKNLFFKIEKAKFPDIPENELLANLIDNITDLDSYYAGLALTVSEGGKISLGDLYNIEELKKSLNSIQIQNEKDKKILEESKMYLETIDQIDRLLRKLSG